MFSRLIPNGRYYHKNVLSHYNNPQNVGSLDKTLKNVGTGLVGSPACGDLIKLQIQVSNDIITDVKFKTFGCGSAIASSSYLTTCLQNKSIQEALQISNKNIANHLNLMPIKLHCSLLAEDAVKAAVKNYQEKQVPSETSEF